MSVRGLPPGGRADFDPQAATSEPDTAAATDAQPGARASRIPGPGRPTIPMPQGTSMEPAKWGGASTLSTDVEVLMDEGASVELAAMVQGALSHATSPNTGTESGRYATALNETIDSLNRQGKLDTFIMLLEDGREDPRFNLTGESLKNWVQANGTEATKRAFMSESLASFMPTPAVLLRDVAEGVNMGVDDLTGMHMERLLRAYDNSYRQPTPDVKRLLDQTIAGLDKKGILDDAIEAMGRRSAQFIRDHPNVRYYPPERQMRDMLSRAASPETLAAWDRATRAKTDTGAEIAKRIEDGLSRSGDREASTLTKGLLDVWTILPTGPSSSQRQIDPAKAKALNEAVAKLSKDGKLDDLIRSLDRDEVDRWTAFSRRHPNVRVMRMPPVKDQLADVIAEAGTPEVKAAWSKAVRASEKPTGHELAADITGALKGGEDDEVFRAADALSTFVTRRYVRAPTEEIAALNQSVLSLSRSGHLDDMAKALGRWDKAHPRKGPFSSFPGMTAQFDAAVRQYGSPEVKRAWAKASG